MSILDAFPHTLKAWARSRSSDELGASLDALESPAVHDGLECWQQPLRDSEIEELSQRGITAECKIYTLEDPQLDERHIVDITNGNVGTTVRFEVATRSLPDATAGLAVVWKTVARKTTTGSTPT